MGLAVPTLSSKYGRGAINKYFMLTYRIYHVLSGLAWVCIGDQQ